MKAIRDMTVGELAAYVAGHLGGRGFDVVLSGGACVMLYSRGDYVSMDLDFVRTGVGAGRRLREALAEIGFAEKGRCFAHPETDFLLDFPGGPLAVGRQPVEAVRTLEFPTGTLRLLSPTDCVKDRLANYFHFGDRQCLHQAMLVTRAEAVDLDDVARWSAAEGKREAFEQVRDALRGARAPGRP